MPLRQDAEGLDIHLAAKFRAKMTVEEGAVFGLFCLYPHRFYDFFPVML